MKSFLVFFILIWFNMLSDKSNIYWENLSQEKQSEIIHSDKIYSGAYNLYIGNFELSDNDDTYELLNALSKLSTDAGVKSLYLHLFNQICKVSDGALSELLGTYCIVIILSDPEYVISYLENDSVLLKDYALYLGSEFYFKEKQTSEIKCNFSDFKQILNERLKNNERHNMILSSLYKEIENVIDKMN